MLLAFLALAASSSVAERQILTTVQNMEAAWNRGDFKGYMAGFANPDVVFVSGGGKLHFYNMKIDLLAPDAAMLIGQYRLERGSRITEGVNTRLLRKLHGRWLITVNHVSAYDLSAPTAPAAK